MAGTMTSWIRSPWQDAGQLTATIDRRADAAPAAGKPLGEWFAALRSAGRQAEAAAFVGHALPRYECVMWAARALLEHGGVPRSDPYMIAALRWLDDPVDANRRAAADLADMAEDDTPGVMLCKAIYLSGGSLAPEDMPPIQPKPDLCAKLASAAVLTAAFAGPEPKRVLDECLSLGETIASGN